MNTSPSPPPNAIPLIPPPNTDGVVEVVVALAKLAPRLLLRGVVLSFLRGPWRPGRQPEEVYGSVGIVGDIF